MIPQSSEQAVELLARGWGFDVPPDDYVDYCHALRLLVGVGLLDAVWLRGLDEATLGEQQ